MNGLPNFLYIGTSKAGSTWIYNVLSHHPDVYMAPGKGLYFFDTHYDRGMDWYRNLFTGANGQRIVGEVSHSYMYSEEASGRIASLESNVRLMVCLREPVERAFSHYLDGIKNGQMHGSFEEELLRSSALLEEGRYTIYLAPYLARFGRERIHVGVFDELTVDPNKFAMKLFGFLGIQERELPDVQRKKMMPAGQPRSKVLVQLAKTTSHAARAIGLRKLRGKVKTSRVIRNMLYRPYAREEKPTMRRETRDRLRDDFREEIKNLDALLGTSFQELWGYK